MKVKLHFLHRARPYTMSDIYENIWYETSAAALPNTGETLKIDGIEHLQGSFFVSERVFHINPQTHEAYVLLLVDVALET
ncbi:hypothetical protein [Wielerella bovis]|uniref:hypothetical protein n=1 Tax=Wielerella bovis TaxID=2917790 RepID=UPI00201A0DC5|nr:hypothetical protein [Wielerella bovis]ULJ60804.1 hypothetical protein MIS44_02780 [Wielerella bovis]ULJ67506.1 hypothetical protein MIS31_02820 [Wielerella bovis]